MTNLDRRVLIGMAGLAGAAAVSHLAKAGSLDPPPGPVAPTGKTTDQIEPRIDLLNAPPSANVTSDASNQYIINNAGSYYLSANLVVGKSVGILVQASGVCLDLCGFNITGPGTGTGIKVPIGNERVNVSNGSVQDFATGIDARAAYSGVLTHLYVSECQVGIYAARLAVIEHCVAFNNSTMGISADTNNARCVISDCLARDNQGIGFYLGAESTLVRCTAYKNARSGISVGGACSLTDCIASSNGSSGATTYGAIESGAFSVLTRCVANANTAAAGFFMYGGSIAIDCIATGNTYDNGDSAGFLLVGASARNCTSMNHHTTASAPTARQGAGFITSYDNCSVEDCIADNNAGAGIYVGSTASNAGTCVRNCRVRQNGFDGICVEGNDVVVSECRAVGNMASGIHVLGGGACVIERNHLLSNATNGLRIDTSVHFVHANIARSNPTNYAIAAGNRVGEIVVAAVNASAISGNSGGAAVTTDPYCNIAF